VLPSVRNIVIAVTAAFFAAFSAAGQTPHTLNYAPGKSITLSLPDAFDINIAASGLKRVRFFAQAPDGRIFATGMDNLTDNSRGVIYILDGWDAHSHTFARTIPYLDHLRNPNSIAFWTDDTTKQTWLYVALTDKLIRYKYSAGEVKHTPKPETLIRFPDYGLNYKYGGWHLTRTIAIAPVGNKTRIFVSVGSSCNYCREREVLRAAIVAMDPDGKNAAIIAHGMRNAVGLAYVPEVDKASLFATNMGDDHLGDKLPEDPFFSVQTSPGTPVNFGWPACYFAGGKAVLDRTPFPAIRDTDAQASGGSSSPQSADDSVYGKQSNVAKAGANLAAGGGHAPAHDPNAALGQAPAPLRSCDQVPNAYVAFPAHSSPLGFAHFSASDPKLGDSFLVALHGAGHPRIGSGYRVVRFTASDRKPQDFIAGFLTSVGGKPVVHGRPCGLLRVGPDAFLLTDDYLGLVYYVHARG
jgi:glucose/arabinose dehydrogenase